MGVPVEPEVVADAVYRVADGSSREYWLGLQTVLTILGNTIVPGYLDRYLARKAVAGQQTDAPLVPDRPDNLDRPVTPLHRTRGSFSKGASLHALLIEGELARAACVVLGAALFFAAGAAAARGRRSAAATYRGSRLPPRRVIQRRPIRRALPFL
jgi:hypothetical protein